MWRGCEPAPGGDRWRSPWPKGPNFSNDVLLEGVIETVINDSPVLHRLPFIEIVGNGLTYNRQNVAATAAFSAVGDTWAESTPTFTQITTALTILGGDADVDNYVARTRNNVQDIEAAVVQLKAKAVQQKFDDTSSPATRAQTRTPSTASTCSAPPARRCR